MRVWEHYRKLPNETVPEFEVRVGRRTVCLVALKTEVAVRRWKRGGEVTFCVCGSTAASCRMRPCPSLR